MKIPLGSILLQAWHDFRRTWPQLVVADLLLRITGVVVLTPAVGLLLKAFLATTETGVVAETRCRVKLPLARVVVVMLVPLTLTVTPLRAQARSPARFTLPSTVPNAWAAAGPAAPTNTSPNSNPIRLQRTHIRLVGMASS